MRTTGMVGTKSVPTRLAWAQATERDEARNPAINRSSMHSNIAQFGVRGPSVDRIHLDREHLPLAGKVAKGRFADGGLGHGAQGHGARARGGHGLQADAVE